jgi:CDP-diglyceride synthetase
VGVGDGFERAASLMMPLLGGLIVHGICIRFGCLRSLAIPVDGGRSIRGKRIFGDNKTFRGFAAVGLGTAAGFVLRPVVFPLADPIVPHWLSQPSLVVFAFGFLVGLCAMLFELPNSFLKRRVGIAPGEQGPRSLGALFYLVDQVDLLAGVWLVLALVMPIEATVVLWSVVLVFVAHQLITVIAYGLGMRSTWR